MAASKKRHPINALTAVQVRNLKAPGRYADGNGLYLVVDPSGARRWLLRIMVKGRRRDIGLGSAVLIPLAEARDAAMRLRKVAREGGDPVLERDREKLRDIPTFKTAAETVHEAQKASWKNAKHRNQWINTLITYAYPHIGERTVDQIETPDILKVLAPIWLSKPETAGRVRQRMRTVLDWAKAAGYREGDNPVDAVAGGLPKQPEKVRHHAALPYQQVPEFMKTLQGSASSLIVKHAFEFLILTAARTGEARFARWDEVSADKRLWTIPASRMKAGREHRVPLSDRCSAILTEAASYRGDSPYLFPGMSKEGTLSDMVFTKILRSLNIPATAHGFRSSFRDWASETTSYPNEVAEMALAHTISNKVEAAYRRGDLLEKRREMMNDWGNYCEATGSDKAGGQSASSERDD
ncbi:tyrosine-type recombinase/integrase [Pelagibacterium montanilacus]|uniref:tyrosine-type recombinase/integrase n=1 Tax=Pelagibacterium montanilacus TaxID=2185280 RepID=UPI000F8F2124|nr:site-specific integrase [Pelagibacterium montanilacus]